MEFRSMIPSLSSDSEENMELMLGYIENLKAELEVKLSAMEVTLNRIKEQINSLKEASV
ncbi:MAG: hypothetical protein IJ454_04535 [Clostridia bacterium]|nr:hypothetical protein [Clostridia bacterium]